MININKLKIYQFSFVKKKNYFLARHYFLIDNFNYYLICYVKSNLYK